MHTLYTSEPTETTEVVTEVLVLGGDIVFSIALTIGVFAIFWLASWLIGKKIFPALINRLDKEKHQISAILLHGFRRPLSFLLKISGIFGALLVICYRFNFDWLSSGLQSVLNGLPSILAVCIRVSIVLACTWGLVASSSITSLLLRNARTRLDLNISKGVTRFLSAVFNVIVIGIAAVILLSELNFNINGLLAGLGLGGLTVALAAKESAANFFGGLILVVEKPFEIGDWITCTGSSGNVEGTVEDINLRDTRIRTWHGSLTIVPNSVLSASFISNWGKSLEMRKADFVLTVVYATPSDKLKRFMRDIRKLLKADKDIDEKSIVVVFTEFGDSSLNIRVVFNVLLPKYVDYLRILDRVNLSLLELANASGVDYAFPTRTVFIESDSGDAADAPKENAEDEASDKSPEDATDALPSQKQP